MLGHAETLLATRMLAHCLHEQGELAQALQLMADRAQLTGLARGVSSTIAQQARAEFVAFTSMTDVG